MIDDEFMRLFIPPSAQSGSTTATKYRNPCATKTELQDYMRDNPNASINDIMTYFNFPSTASVRNHLTRAGLIKRFDKPRMTPTNEKIIKCHKENPELTKKEIAKKVRVSYETVLITFRKLNNTPDD